MRVKRQKQYRKSMAVYANAFKFREPYQVLVDGTFIAAALKLRADIYSSLSSVLVATAKPMTTQCVIEELRSLGEDMSGAVIAGKRLERRRCVHEKTVPAAECLKLIIGEENQFNYCVATQDIELRRHFRKVPGVPLVYINKSVFILEPVSTATERKIADLEKQKTLPKPQEVKILKKMADPNYDEAAEAAAAAAAAAQAEKDKKRKKREKKLLAIKKLRLKKRKLAQTEGTVAKGKRKRDDDQNGEKSDFSESGGEGGVKERSIGEVSAKRRKQVKKVVKVEEGEEAEEVKS
ncbi:Fcf1-domain-containing protein [Cladochytrium replicatum]|nr:Fcf1-domain-containing protein [Cladochytrium replicatum]